MRRVSCSSIFWMKTSIWFLQCHKENSHVIDRHISVTLYINSAIHDGNDTKLNVNRTSLARNILRIRDSQVPILIKKYL